jgi:hypothetical protein
MNFHQILPLPFILRPPLLEGSSTKKNLPFKLMSFFFFNLDSAPERKQAVFIFQRLVNMLNMMISSSIHFPANDMIALLFLVE